MIAKEWKGYGFDSVELVNYTVLLSYPNKTLPNTLRIIDSMGIVKYDSHIGQEPPLTPHEDDPDVASPFNAFSGSGNVTVGKSFRYIFNCLAELGRYLGQKHR